MRTNLFVGFLERLSFSHWGDDPVQPLEQFIESGVGHSQVLRHIDWQRHRLQSFHPCCSILSSFNFSVWRFHDWRLFFLARKQPVAEKSFHLFSFRATVCRPKRRCPLKLTTGDEGPCRQQNQLGQPHTKAQSPSGKLSLNSSRPTSPSPLPLPSLPARRSDRTNIRSFSQGGAPHSSHSKGNRDRRAE